MTVSSLREHARLIRANPENLPDRALNADPDCMCSAPESTRHRRLGTARLGMGVAATGVHAGLWLIATPVAIALTSLEAVLAATVILTALYASPLLSERAFRMLPWTRQPSSASIPAA
jgi:hypothetical protein